MNQWRHGRFRRAEVRPPGVPSSAWATSPVPVPVPGSLRADGRGRGVEHGGDDGPVLACVGEAGGLVGHLTGAVGSDAQLTAADESTGVRIAGGERPDGTVVAPVPRPVGIGRTVA
jgi:hypothetical protein